MPGLARLLLLEQHGDALACGYPADGFAEQARDGDDFDALGEGDWLVSTLSVMNKVRMGLSAILFMASPANSPWVTAA